MELEFLSEEIDCAHRITPPWMTGIRGLKQLTPASLHSCAACELHGEAYLHPARRTDTMLLKMASSNMLQKDAHLEPDDAVLPREKS